MELQEVIKNLKEYNGWRRDNDNIFLMPHPKKIGETIDSAIYWLEKLG